MKCSHPVRVALCSTAGSLGQLQEQQPARGPRECDVEAQNPHTAARDKAQGVIASHAC